MTSAFPRPFPGPTSFGDVSSVGLLLGSGEADGLAMDFTEAYNSLLIRKDYSAVYKGPAFDVSTGPANFTRASNATVTDSDGILKWAPHNLLTNSESFDASAWTKTNLTVNANNTGAPNGTTTADALFETTTNAAHQALQTQTVLASTTYTVGVFVKANGRTKGGVGFVYTAGSFDGFSIDFDLVAQTATPSINGTGVCTNSGITSLGNGWFYVFGTGSIGNFTSAYAVCKVLNDAGAANYAGDITKGLIFWGAHLYRSDLGGMQANTSAYPMYNPTTPKNLLGYTEDFSNAAWAKTGTVTITPNFDTAPNGLLTADRFVSTGGSFPQIAQFVNLVAGTSYTFSMWVKSDGTSQIAQAILLGGSVTAFTPTSTWTRVSVTVPSTAGGSIGAVLATNSGTAPASSFLIWGAQLSDSASLDPYFPDYDVAPTSAAYYGPRRDFDPVTLACKGLLVEEQRTNLLTYSDAFDNAAWAKTAATVTANAAVSPNGTTTADKIVEDTSTGAHYVGQIVGTVGATETISFYAKPAGRNWVLAQLGTGGLAYFDVQNGVLGTIVGGTASISNAGNGWFRCSLTAVRAANANNLIYCASANGTFSYTGDGTSGIYIWGAQLEAGSFATSYIPTGAATATRSADVASVSTQAFPYSSTEGTWVANWSALASVSSSRIIGSSLANDTTPLFLHASSTAVGSWDGATVLVSSSGPSTLGPVKAALGYSASGRALVYAGTSATSDSAVMPAVSQFYMGRGLTASYLNGHIRQITYLPRRISNTELQTRTA